MPIVYLMSSHLHTMGQNLSTHGTLMEHTDMLKTSVDMWW